MTTRRLLLVYPRNARASYRGQTITRALLRKDGGFMSPTLPTIAAVTPGDFTVAIVDELLDEIDPQRHYDVVGLTSAATQLARTVELSRELRARGSLVVIGGPAATMGPDRWREHADVLVLGEAERVWPRFLADYLAGRHEAEYRETERFDLAESPVPDYRGLPEATRRQYLSGVVQTSRGCPHGCEFCAVTRYVGGRMRYKAPAQVIAEVEQLVAMGFRTVFLADDNFAADRAPSRAILEALRDWGRSQRRPPTLVTQLSIDIADDEAWLALAAEAGLTRVLIGIESPDEACLREARKAPNLGRDLEADLRVFHRQGITTVLATIIGFDHDDLSAFRRHHDFLMGQGAPLVQVLPLQALDGTPLKERLIKEGRYVDWAEACTVAPEDASVFNTFTLVPKQMTVAQLQQGLYWLFWDLYRLEHVHARLQRFFDEYDAGPRPLARNAASRALDAEALGVGWRLLKHLTWRASRAERRAFLRLLRAARRSSHPQRFELATFAYVMAKSSQEVLLAEEPAIDQIDEPKACLSSTPEAI